MTLDQTAGLLDEFDYFVLASHDGPDADGLGAAYALGVLIEARGKSARILLLDPLPAKMAFIDHRGWFSRIHDSPELPFEAARTCAIVLDTHDFAFLGTRMESLVRKAARLAVIDHHELKGLPDERFYLDPTASSTSEMVWRLYSRLGIALPLDAAEAVFWGIVYDTGSFSYPKTGAGTFECALELVRLGVKPYLVHGMIYESATTPVLLLQKTVNGTLQLSLGNKVAFQVLLRADLVATGASYEDAEDFVNMPLQGAEIQVSALIKEREDGRFRCSLRSKGKVNVARLAQDFGGGGHATAAGFTSSLSLEALKSALMRGLEPAFPAP
jgi:phosphoesterase RecJ-like protein